MILRGRLLLAILFSRSIANHATFLKGFLERERRAFLSFFCLFSHGTRYVETILRRCLVDGLLLGRGGFL